jgi:hypothetical protein
MSFTQGAARLAGVAGWLLGWRPDEFWRATPDELASVLRAAAGECEDEAGVDGDELRRLMAAMPDRGAQGCFGGEGAHG